MFNSVELSLNVIAIIWDWEAFSQKKWSPEVLIMTHVVSM